jgi:hypothetical protein
MRIEGSIPLRPSVIGSRPMRQLLAAMITATEAVLGYVEGPESPERVCRLGRLGTSGSSSSRMS